MLNESILFNQRLNSSLNDSSTKQAYSFGRAERFKMNEKKDNYYHFYDLPNTRNNRSTTLGFGKKCSQSTILGCGSNQLYPAPNYFDPKKHNSPVYSFGSSRPKNLRYDRTPGPIYDVSTKLGRGPGFVFGTSGLRKKRLSRSSSIPGPGAYYNEENHKIGFNYSSKLINSANVVIGREKRFLKKDKDKTPGPGAYDIPGLINNTGIIKFNSKYISFPARSILGKKNTYRIKNIDSGPGPGQYNFFSIFEGYSQDNKK